MKSEVSVTYVLGSFEFDPDEITAKTGIIPTHIARIDEPISAAAKVKPQITPKIKTSRWEVKSDIAPSANLETHFKALIKRLEPGWSALVELGTQYGGVFSCTIWDYNDERPEMFFEQSIIKCVFELNAGIEAIVYQVDRRSKQTSEYLVFHNLEYAKSDRITQIT